MKILASILRAAFAFLPFVLMTYGVWLVYEPAAYIALGLMLYIDHHMPDWGSGQKEDHKE